LEINLHIYLCLYKVRLKLPPLGSRVFGIHGDHRTLQHTERLGRAEGTQVRKYRDRWDKHNYRVSWTGGTNTTTGCPLTRTPCIPPPPTVHNTGRTVFIGGSNLGRITKAAAENGHMIVDLTAKGWIPKSGKIDRLCETLQKLKLTEIDTVVIDSMSNTAFLGTDEDGLPIPSEKSVENGRYHLNGDLQLAPPPRPSNPP
jgi:hypothetical protein